MSLLTFVLIICVLGVGAYLINRYVPMPDVAKTVLNIVFVAVTILLFLDLLGIYKLPFALK